MLEELTRKIRGDVRSDSLSRYIYSLDASIYQIEPMCVVLPKTKDDVFTTVTIAEKYGVPIIPRGGGTGTAGGCIGHGIVLDFTKYMNKIVDIDLEASTVVCEPGVVQDQLNSELEKYGVQLGPDTSTGNRATLGGMLANNSSGSRSTYFGKMIDHIQEVELVLPDASGYRMGPITNEDLKSRQGNSDWESSMFQLISRIRNDFCEDINNRFPRIHRRVSGYNLDELLKTDNLNLAKLVAGSEGTLGVISELTMRIVPKLKCTGICILQFTDVKNALKDVESILEFNPIAVELIDHHIIENGSKHPSMQGRLEWLDPTVGAILIIEITANNPVELEEKLVEFERSMKSNHVCDRVRCITKPELMKEVWKLRKLGLSFLMARRTSSRALPFLEDMAVPPQSIGPFIEAFSSCVRKYGKEAGIFGHVAAGCVHTRPLLDLKQSDDQDTMFEMMEALSTIVLEFGGSISGEHGDGIVRSWLLEKMFGARLYQVFGELKSIFDPKNRMNPGKITNPANPRENLRQGLSKPLITIDTFLDFKEEGGFSNVVGMCNSNGECRKLKAGTMCPSYRATLDEWDTTRARAQSLMSFVTGESDPSQLYSQKVYDVLEHCIECKGCKRECPSEVDMAKIKMEFLYHYNQFQRPSLRTQMFANIASINNVASIAPRLANYLMAVFPGKRIMQALGVASEREFPIFTNQRFSRWFRNRNATIPDNSDTRVLLFVDTYTEFYYPHIGRAAVAVLEKLGCYVAADYFGCCGRPLLSKGFLDKARKRIERLVARLTPFVDDGYHVVGLEPSCVSVFIDDATSVLNNQTVRKLSESCCSIDEFLYDLLTKKKKSHIFTNQKSNVAIHGHCHQKALETESATASVLNLIPSFEVHTLNTGCCGMAGAFGYEQEHYDFSLKIAETQLFPKIRELDKDDVILANGVSCRQQIQHGTNRRARHIVEILADKLVKND